MLYALSIGKMLDGVEIIMAISRQIFGNSELLFKPKSAKLLAGLASVSVISLT